MGEVYRARDLKLKREVAIKILPEEFAQDSDRVSRFQREAEVLASLNHPNIAGIHDLQEANGSRYLVLELVEGETLADRLKRGPIPLDEAVPIAKQIVDALEAAHDRGIVHRDLKPGNIKRTPEGAVKVLDFGLAKAAQGRLTSDQGFSNSPRLMSGSMGGVILGTAAYMSPEQARGKQVDARTDIWAFGCVLYEMLTGQQTFTGETTTDILAKVLEAQPKWEALPAETPSSIRFLLETALNKDPKQRLQSIGAARALLNRPATLDKSATATDEDGKDQVVVQPFPVRGLDKWQVTAQGGTQPVWKRDGRELYYLAPDGKLMAVSVTTDPTFQAGQTSTLFQTSLTPTPLPFGHSYAVSADGQQFLLANASSPVADSSSITVVVNWPAVLRKK
jgi:serine/threonine-protein kinase